MVAKRCGDFRVDFFHDGNGSIKSLQRDVIAGRWDDWILSLVASAWMAAEDRRGGGRQKVKR